MLLNYIPVDVNSFFFEKILNFTEKCIHANLKYKTNKYKNNCCTTYKKLCLDNCIINYTNHTEIEKSKEIFRNKKR